MSQAAKLAPGLGQRNHAARQVPPSGLPAQATAFVGRYREVATARDLLCSTEARLLTLTGPPGVGKTRLAIQVASGIGASFPGGIYFVPLAAVTRAEAMIAHIAQALGLKELSNLPLLQRVQEHLGDKQILLVLDNLEQVEDPALTIGALLTAGPSLKILATSRTRLQVYGEHEFRVPAMSVPDLGPVANLQTLSRVEAVALFVQRARAANVEFKLTRDNAEAVAQICAKLEGLPLAIELAAARTRLLTPQELVHRLEDRLALLTGGPLDLPARQQTLEAAVAWSYDLLSQEEQRLFRRLAVFSGGFTLEAVSALERQLADEPVDGSMALLESLHDKSLVTQTTYGEEIGGEVRFTMLETIRVYAEALLLESGEWEAARKAHALYFLRRAAERPQRLFSPEGKATFDRLEREHDNVRAALLWCSTTTDPEGVEIGLGLVNAMRLFWDARAYLLEQRNQLAAILPRAGECANAAYARALQAMGRVETLLGNPESGIAYLQEALRLLRTTGDTEWIIVALDSLGHAAIHMHDSAAAEAYFRECAELQAATGDKAGLANTIGRQADLALHNGDKAEAREMFAQALSIAREADMPLLVAELQVFIAYANAEDGEYDRLIAMLCESLETLQAMDAVQDLAYATGVLGKIAYLQGYHEWAVRTFSAASTLFSRCGLPLEPPLHTDPAEYERYLAELREKMGEQSFSAAWEKGQTLDTGQIVAEYRRVLAGEPWEQERARPEEPAATSAGLTARELEVLRLVASGMTNQEAATTLMVSYHTINMHLRSIYSKLGVSSRSAATRYALLHRLIDEA